MVYLTSLVCLVLRSHIVFFLHRLNRCKKYKLVYYFYNLDEELWPAIKSFLIFLNRVHENPKTKVHEIEADDYCLQQLKEL